MILSCPPPSWFSNWGILFWGFLKYFTLLVLALSIEDVNRFVLSYNRSVNCLLTYYLVLSNFFFCLRWYFLLGTSNPDYSVGMSIGTLNVLGILRIKSLMILIFMGHVRCFMAGYVWWIKSESFVHVLLSSSMWLSDYKYYIIKISIYFIYH